MKLFGTHQISKGAMVIAVIALVAALGGGAIAAKKKKVGTNQLANGAVTGKKLSDQAVATKITVTKVDGGKLVVDQGKSASGTITCPTGTQAISGGAEPVAPNNGAPNGSISGSFRSTNEREWTIRVDAPVANPASWTISALCSNI